jgi:hypothetical protein
MWNASWIFFSFRGKNEKKKKFCQCFTQCNALRAGCYPTLMIGSDLTHGRFTLGNALLGVYSASSLSLGFTLVTHLEAGRHSLVHMGQLVVNYDYGTRVGLPPYSTMVVSYGQVWIYFYLGAMVHVFYSAILWLLDMHWLVGWCTCWTQLCQSIVFKHTIILQGSFMLYLYASPI